MNAECNETKCQISIQITLDYLCPKIAIAANKRKSCYNKNAAGMIPTVPNPINGTGLLRKIG